MTDWSKTAIFTDIHWGNRANERTHNEDCRDFVDWMLSEIEKEGIREVIFMGDWHSNRNSIHLTTLNFSLDAMEKICQAVDKFYFILGNHDLHYRENRDITSVSFGRNLDNLVIVDKPMQVGDVGLVPWLIGNEHKMIRKWKSRYVFGHFEIPGFLMNAKIEMPENGHYTAADFTGPELVFSGHFHKRQQKGNIIYIGNPFPHNYADAWDDDRGFAILDHASGAVEFRNWPDCPKFRTIRLSDLAANPDLLAGGKVYARVTIDIDISFEDAQVLKNGLIEPYSIRRLDLIHQRVMDDITAPQDHLVYKSVDQIVTEGIMALESESMDRNTLIEIYSSLSV